MKVLDVLLHDLPTGWQVQRVVIGTNWVLSVLSAGGEQRAGMASAPPVSIATSDRSLGENVVGADAASIAQLVESPESGLAAVGMATLNALLQPDRAALSEMDAADWLCSRGTGRRVAIFGRFPFIQDELRPVAAKVWVFELQPRHDEYGAEHIAEVLPQADIVAITSSTLINHTIDDILWHAAPSSTVMVLGPGTPLSSRLFLSGIDILSGVEITNIVQAEQSVLAGVLFRQMKGFERVTLCNKRTVRCET